MDEILRGVTAAVPTGHRGIALQLLVGSIAEWWGGCPFATTQIGSVGLISGEGYRLKPRTLV